VAKFCIDCGKVIDKDATRCRACYLLYHKKVYPNCVDCGKKLTGFTYKRCGECVIKYQTGKNNPFYGKHHTKETVEFLRNENLGEKGPGYIDGRTLKQYYCKLCGNPISVSAALHKRGICIECKHKLHSIVMLGNTCNPRGEKSSNYKNGLPKCIDCGKEINYGKTRCGKCNGKVHSILMSGENNPMFGKVTHGKFGKYNDVWMRSGWEVAYAKWLDKNNIKWLYEPKAFMLVLNGKDVTYTPDFYLPTIDRYIEIKGWWRGDAKEKFNQFLNTYSDVDLVVFGKEKLVELGVLK
jgi:hypothetical protein